MKPDDLYPQLRFYSRMSRIPLPRGFVGKLLAIRFVGTHISIGVVESAEEPGATLSHLLARADIELYRANDLGRNRVSAPTRRGSI